MNLFISFFISNIREAMTYLVIRAIVLTNYHTIESGIGDAPANKRAFALLDEIHHQVPLYFMQFTALFFTATAVVSSFAAPVGDDVESRSIDFVTRAESVHMDAPKCAAAGTYVSSPSPIAA